MVTSYVLDYQPLWYTVHKSWFQFAAAGTHSLHVLLAKYPGNSTHDVILVIFATARSPFKPSMDVEDQSDYLSGVVGSVCCIDRSSLRIHGYYRKGKLS